MERVRHCGRNDLPNLRRAEPRRDVDPVHRERTAIDPHHVRRSARHGRCPRVTPRPGPPIPPIPAMFIAIIPIIGSSTKVRHATADPMSGAASVASSRGSRMTVAFNAESGWNRMKASVLPAATWAPHLHHHHARARSVMRIRRWSPGRPGGHRRSSPGPRSARPERSPGFSLPPARQEARRRQQSRRTAAGRRSEDRNCGRWRRSTDAAVQTPAGTLATGPIAPLTSSVSPWNPCIMSIIVGS